MSLRGHFVAAALVYALDVWVVGMGMFSFLVALVVGVTIALSRLPAGDAAAFRTKLWKLGVWCLVPGVMYGTMVVQTHVAQSRADRVVSAIEGFHAKEGRYPARLAELVPGYLPSIPRAHPRVVFDEYHYYPGSDGKTSLTWVVYPPFYRATYDFADRTWSRWD